MGHTPREIEIEAVQPREEMLPESVVFLEIHMTTVFELLVSLIGIDVLVQFFQFSNWAVRWFCFLRAHKKEKHKQHALIGAVGKLCTVINRIIFYVFGAIQNNF